jgi:alkylhydroperoxidase family enzyme
LVYFDHNRRRSADTDTEESVMPLLNIVPPDEAQGVVAENYSLFLKMAGMVPAPFQMMSVSPALQSMVKGQIQYYFGHPTLNPALLAMIRLLVAEQNNYHYCVSLNTGVLKQFGIADDDQVMAMMADPGKAPLSDKDRAMLSFVLKAVKTPQAVEAADVEGLRALGWTDADILDATAHGVNMVSTGIMFKAFKMDEAEAC